MAFDSLTEKLQNVFKNLRSKGRLTEDDVKEALKEIKRALLAADVNFKERAGACDRSGCNEWSESGTDGDQDCK